ncbi:copper radical oxidase [Macrolepiota fuliginosa MF-IS2]|uniref:Copper radical oxidase n=1 Tax=Macrolepiota fuliginosa MF-IS2 TaxID=1400762 RepID=A0A9P5XJJ9_9AGAR|nr:copper radical oxidase [Macrolepiota fuliginosa MF-IS2]
MFRHPLSFLALWLASTATRTVAQKAGSFSDGGNTLVSAMMMFVGNEEKVYIMDKAEGNEARIGGHPAWGSVWDLNTHKAEAMDVKTNIFCSSGMHLPNGSFIALGGNGAVGRGGNVGSQMNPNIGAADWDSEYQDFDGGKSIRVLNPCTSADDMNSAQCRWFDEPTILSMRRRRWYSAAEALEDGNVIIIGGFANGGYVNRNYPNKDPQFEGGAAECTYEFYPPRNEDPKPFQFLVQTSGLNAYAHTFLMPSGKLFVQANVSTVLWDYNANAETPLPPMPNGVVRVYPASGAAAMLPLTPDNGYNPTIIFCGGSDMPEYAYGNYSFPFINTWEYPASKDCQRITPEPKDGSAPTYQQDDDMLEGRTMGQFIVLPDLKLLVVNGGSNGTAGYAQATGQTPSYDLMAYGESLASGPVGRPAIYDPKAPKGKRWSNAGFDTSNIARLYHSSAMILPDASVLIGGSNPNVDVNLTTVYPTTYKAEIFYPPYFAAKTRPKPTGMPKTLSYGGDSFDLTIPSESYSGSSNDAAESAMVTLIRGGFTTHAMNMGQRAMQLNNTFTVKSDGTIVLHVAQPPPNPFIFQPGPAYLYTVINGVPSNGSYVIVGNGQLGKQPTAADSTLPDSIRMDNAMGSAAGGSTDLSGGGSTNGATSNTVTIIAGVVGSIVVIGLIGALIGVFLVRRRRAAQQKSHPAYAMNTAESFVAGGGAAGGVAGAGAAGFGGAGVRSSDSSAFLPMKQDNSSQVWKGDSLSYHGRPSSTFSDSEETYDVHGRAPRSPTTQPMLQGQSPTSPGFRY